MSKSYVAFIADAIASRELSPATRARLQADARAAVKDLNQRYRRVLAARFAVTLGDELQCLLPTPQPVWDLAHDLRDGRPLLSRSPGRDGPRQASAPGVRVRRLRSRARPARQLLLRAVLELDPPPAPYR